MTRAAIHKDLRSLLPNAIFHVAANGSGAVDAVRNVEELHLAFLDVKMPGFNGLEVAEKLKLRWKDCQVVFLTAYSDFQIVQNALTLGASDYLLKPFDITELSGAVQKALDRLRIACMERERLTRAESERDKLTQWVDDRLLRDMLGGVDFNDDLYRQWENVGVSFQSGAFAILDCGDARMAPRIAGLVRGDAWDVQLRMFMRERVRYLFLLCVSSIREDTASLLAQQMQRLHDKIRRLLHASVKGVVGTTFYKLEGGRTAGFSCFMMLRRCTDDVPLVRLSEQSCPPSLEMRIGKGETQQALRMLRLWFDYFEAQDFPFSVCQEQMAAIFEAAHIGHTELAPRICLFRCKDRQELMECAADMIRTLTANGIEDDPGEEAAENMDAAVRIKKYLAGHFREEITLESVSAELGWSRTYFSKLCKQLLGQNFNAYITGLRIEEAKRLLRDGAVPIREVAFRSGFREPSYFSNIFRKTVGILPSEYWQRELEK